MNADCLRKYWLIISILLLAAFVRILGIWHGYPYSYYPDEAFLVKKALSFGSFDFNPYWFHKPAFYKYILFFEYGIYFLAGKTMGFWASVHDFAVSFIKNPGPFYIIGRLATVLFSLGSIWAVFKIGERHFSKSVGIMAALLLSLSAGHVWVSQDIKEDTPCMFFVILSIFFLLNYCMDRKKRALFWSVVFAGMGTATKQYGIVMLVPISAGLLLIRGEEEASLRGRLREAVILVALAFVGFWVAYLVCSPYNFLDPLGRQATFGDFFRIMERIGHFVGGEKVVRPGDFIGQRMNMVDGFVDYFKVIFSANGMGLPISAIGIAGYGYLLCKLDRNIFLFLLYPTIFAFISVFHAPGYAEARHQLSIYPFLAISGAAFIVYIAGSGGLRSKLVYLIVVISLLYPFSEVLKRDFHKSKEDTRNIAKAWIEENIPSGTKILIDENGPQLMMTESRLKTMLQAAEKANPKGQFTAHYETYLKYQLLAAKDSITYDLHETRLPWWQEEFHRNGIHELTSGYDRDAANPLKPVGVERYENYVNNGFEFAVVISDRYETFLKEDSFRAKRYPSFYKLYRDLFDRGKLVKEFSSGGNLTGPVIKIFEFSN